MTFSLGDAIKLAVDAHANQVDKVGEAYVLHPLRVMFTFPPYEVEQRMTAVLHDVLEDTDFTAEDFLRLGVPPAVIVALVALTHRNNEPYLDYVATVNMNALARQVKIADIADNMSMERLLRLDQHTVDRLLKKYRAALEILDP